MERDAVPGALDKRVLGAQSVDQERDQIPASRRAWDPLSEGRALSRALSRVVTTISRLPAWSSIAEAAATMR
jgi:hypothetical protein